MEQAECIGNNTVPLWKIPQLLTDGDLMLPSFQRDAVWDERRVELLWDSLMRGMPIGNFIVCPKDKVSEEIRSRKAQNSRCNAATELESGQSEKDEHLLLIDGQQRAVSIRQGIKAWDKNDPFRLWIDVAPDLPAVNYKKNHQVRFSFHLCTTSWPWGLNIPDGMWRECRTTLGNENSDVLYYDDKKTEKPDYSLPLGFTWPGKAILPVPFSEIIMFFKQEADYSNFQEMIDKGQKPFKREKIEDFVKNLFRDTLVAKAMRNHWYGEYKNKKNEDCKSEKAVVDWIEKYQFRVFEVLNREIFFEKAFNVIWDEEESKKSAEEMAEGFFRINRLGSRLSNEEIFFSGLKQKWPDAHKLVWEIYQEKNTGRLIDPAGIVHAAVRLAVSKKNSNLDPEENQLPDPLNLELKHVKIFLEKDNPGTYIFDSIQELVNNDAPNGLKNIFTKMRKILEYIPSDPIDRSDYGIPLPLLSEIGRSKPHIFHNLLAWLWQNADNQDSASIVRCDLVRYAMVDYFLLSSTYKYYLKESLTKAFASKSKFPVKDIIEIGTSRSWDLRIDYFRSEDNKFAFMSPSELCNNANDRLLKEANFSRRLFLLWVQRFYIQKNFPGYDPTLFFNRSALPWDVDHIWPQAWAKKSIKSTTNWRIPEFIDYYLHSLGNLRILDKRDNRGDQAKIPKIKFPDTKLTKENFDEYWAIPESVYDDFCKARAGQNYVASNSLLDLHRAILDRSFMIYAEFYETFNLGDFESRP
jgi:hypothetical protein